MTAGDERLPINVPAIGAAMIAAARAEVADRWPRLELLAEPELRRLAQSFADTADLFADGRIHEAHARQLVHMHQISARLAIRTLDGVGLLTAEQAIHAGVRTAAAAINALVKFTLL